jgi:translocation and assembly module TamB
VRAADLVVGIDHGKLSLYAGTARLAGGSIAASGDLSRGQRLPGSLVVAANRIQLGQIRPAGAPLFNGELTGVASTHRNRRAQQQLELSGTARNFTVSGRTMSVDADLGYNGRSLTSHGSRVLIDDGSAVNINGFVNTPSQTQLSAARLHLNATIRNGDLAQLAASAYADAPVTGGLDANLRITGTLAQPQVAGELRSDVGTFRGVTYENMRAGVAAAAGSIALQGGHLAIGNSALDVSGVLAGDSADLRVASPFVDLTDFNDFFNGKDIFAGTGSLNVHVALAPGQRAGNGFASLRDVAIEHVPIGSVRATFTTPHRNVIAADITQHGALANTHLIGTITFAGGGSALASLRHASYQARADLRNMDLSLLTPELPSVTNGLRGKLNLLADVTGRPGQLVGFANFNLADGFIRKDRIEEFSGRVTSDGDELNLQRFRTHVAGLDIAAHGVYSAHRQIAASVLISAPKLQDLERIAQLPNAVQGAATLALDASGTASRPRVRAMLRGSKGSAYGVAYERVNADADYAPGIVAVRDASVDLAHKHGTIALGGAVPVAFGPQPTRNGVVVDPPLAMTLQLSGIGLDAFNPVIKDKGSVEGRLDARATMTGSLRQPVLSGAAQVRGATIRSKLETVPLTNLNADVALSNKQIRLSKFHGKLGRGTVDLSGIVQLLAQRPGRMVGKPDFNMHLVAQKANVSVPQLFSGVVDADVGIDTIRQQPLVAGKIVASDTDIPFSGIIALASGSTSGPPQAAQIPGVPPLRKGHVIAYGGQIYGPEVQFVHPTPRPQKIKRPRLPLALSLDVTAGDNVQVTGLVNATGTGTLHASGTLSSPQVSGDIVAIRGEVSAFDTVFHLLRGDVAFSPSDGLLPTIQAQAIAYRPEADVTVTIDGRVDQMHTTIESDPPMSQQAILANILHINEINSALSGQSGQSLGTGASVGSLAGGLVTGKLLAAMNYGLERTLHIEEVNLAFNSNGQPTLEVRKNYGKNMYALYRTTLVAPPSNEVGMVYALRNALEVQFLEKQNTAGQTQWQQGQYTTFRVTYSLRQKQPKSRKRTTHP